jgi:hypothetical protein
MIVVLARPAVPITGKFTGPTFLPIHTNEQELI